MYGNEFVNALRMEAAWSFPRQLSLNTNDFSLENTLFNSDKQKAGTGRRSLGSIVGPETHCYTLEVSFYGYYKQPQAESSQIVPYTACLYQNLGTNLGKTFASTYLCS